MSPYDKLDADMEPITSRDVKIPCPPIGPLRGGKLMKNQRKIRNRVYQKIRGWLRWKMRHMREDLIPEQS